MAHALGLELPREEINAANAAVLGDLNSAGSAAFALRIANALMLTHDGGAIAKDYVSLLSQKYAAEVFRNADLAAVNGWVREKTNGKNPFDSRSARSDDGLRSD